MFNNSRRHCNWLHEANLAHSIRILIYQRTSSIMHGWLICFCYFSKGFATTKCTVNDEILVRSKFWRLAIFWLKSSIFNPPIIFLHRYTYVCTSVCDIHQYLIHQNVFCTTSPNIILANISSYTIP